MPPDPPRDNSALSKHQHVMSPPQQKILYETLLTYTWAWACTVKTASTWRYWMWSIGMADRNAQFVVLIAIWSVQKKTKFFEIFSHLVLYPIPIFWELAILWAQQWWQNQLLYPLHMCTQVKISRSTVHIGIGKGVGSGGHTQPSYWLLVCQHRLSLSTKRMNHHINIICVYYTYILEHFLCVLLISRAGAKQGRVQYISQYLYVHCASNSFSTNEREYLLNCDKLT